MCAPVDTQMFFVLMSACAEDGRPVSRRNARKSGEQDREKKNRAGEGGREVVVCCLLESLGAVAHDPFTHRLVRRIKA
jgi:hypothetical protein